MRPALIMGLTVVTIGLFIAGGMSWHAVLWRTGWFQGPPPIVRDLITGVEDGPWTRRLRETYPVGSSEEVMVDSLEEQGFDVRPEAGRATYGWADYPCVYTLTLAWRGDEARRISAIQGSLYNACTDGERLLPERPQRPPQRRGPAPRPSLVAPAQSA